MLMSTNCFIYFHPLLRWQVQRKVSCIPKSVTPSRILENIRILRQSGKPFLFRVPLIPGITDTEENLRAISRIVEDAPVELLKYNPFAGAKYDTVGLTYSLPELRNRDEDFTKYFQNATIA